VDTVDGRLTDVLVTPAREAGITLVGLVELADFVRRQETLERLQIEFAHAARISTHGELTVSIAHELNQPLGAIAVNCETSLNAAVDLPFDLEDHGGRIEADNGSIHGGARFSFTLPVANHTFQ